MRLQTMDEIRWGIIGCGDVTEQKSGPALQKAEGSSLVAVMRRDAGKAEDYAKRHGVPRSYSDAADLIGDPTVTAIYVATPPVAHAKFVIQAAQAGKPVYVEKPMARTFAECEEMNAACCAAGVPLFVAYYRRALPRFLKVKELLEEGAIGEVRLVNIQHCRPPEKLNGVSLPWRLDQEVSGGGLFVDLGSHTLDLFDFLLGPIACCAGHAANLGQQYLAEDTVAGTFRFATGVLGTGFWCFAAPMEREMNEIIGSRGRLRFSTFGSEPVVLERDGKLQEWNFTSPTHIQQPLIQTVVNDLLHGTQNCASTGITAARTSRIIDTILRDFQKGT